MYVVSGETSGWKISVAKVRSGGCSGYAGGNAMRKRRIEGA
jgi:hypothetical protein